MTTRMKYLVASCFLATSAICISLYIGHKKRLAQQAATPPYVLCTVTAIKRQYDPDLIDVEMEISTYNVNGGTVYKVIEDKEPLIKEIGYEIQNLPYRYGEKFSYCMSMEYFSPLTNLDEVYYYEGMYGLPDQYSCDWRNPTTLLEVGKTYRVTPEKPLLIARGLHKDGGIVYHWLTVSTDQTKASAPHTLNEQARLGSATTTESKTRYWLTHAAYDAEPNRVHTRFAWLGETPSVDLILERMAPEFCWVENSEIISEPIQVKVSATYSNSISTADMSIFLPEIPENAPDDIWLRMNFSQGSTDHLPVEIPVRRRTFNGEDEYPLGTRMVWRKGQLYTDPAGNTIPAEADNIAKAPQIGAVLIYGATIYKLDPKTGISTSLWTAPSAETKKACSLCTVSPDGNHLAFIYDLKLHLLDLNSLESVAVKETLNPPNLTRISQKDPCAYEVIYDPQIRRISFQSPDEEYPISIAIDSLKNSESFSLSYDKGIVFAHNRDEVVAYDTHTGERLWNKKIYYSPIVAFSPDKEKVWTPTRTGWNQYAIDTGDKLSKIDLHIPYIDEVLPLPQAEGFQKAEPWMWEWEKDANTMAVAVQTRALHRPRLYIFDAQDENSLNARQCITNYNPTPYSFVVHADIAPYCFIDENFLMVRCINNAGMTTEYLCIDLREVPKI